MEVKKTTLSNKIYNDIIKVIEWNMGEDEFDPDAVAAAVMDKFRENLNDHGWQIVPKDSTREMWQAGKIKLAEGGNEVHCYDVMLAKAPDMEDWNV